MALTATSTSVIQKPVNVVFEQTFLRRAQQMCPYFLGTEPGTLMTQQGTNIIKWRRIEQETPSTSALSEISTASYMQGHTPDTPTFTDVTATMAKYGQFYITTEEMDLYNPNGTAGELVAVLGESAGRTLNMLQRDIAEDNATQQFAGNVASDGAVQAVITVGDLDLAINTLTRNSARTFSPMTPGSPNIGTAPILPAYWAACHPDVAYDVSKLSGFKSVETYAGQTSIAMGEFGYYARAGRGVRFVISEDASVNTGVGGPLSGGDLRATSTVADTYTVAIWGQGAHGSVGLGKRHTDGTYQAGENQGGFELISHPKGSGGTSDPFNEIATLAHKEWWAGAVLNSNWSRAIVCAATNLSN